jgi:membrane-bound ClpP family serine protease
MTLTAILILIAVGLLLILIEFLVLPGTNIAGILGILMIIAGIYYGYRDIGTPIANYILAGSLVFMAGSITYVLRAKTWQKLSLNSAINSKFENIETLTVKPGDKGKSITRLNPVGTIIVNEKTFEGKSGHRFIDPNTPIEVIKVVGNQLLVKPIE